ncbi:MAG: STAS domain-containing protein [Actinomycetota bacterium]
MSELGTELLITPDDAGFVLSGEIDAHTAPELEDALSMRIEQQPALRLDMRAVTFMDSSGLRALIGATNETRSRGGDVTVQSPTAVVRRLIEISGLSDHLSVTE